MDQEGNSHLQERTTSHEPWRRQLPTQHACHIRPISWHIYLLCQKPKKMMHTFFWWRLLMEV